MTQTDKSPNSQKITPFLWFDQNAEEAVAFYTGLFPDARVTTVARYPDTMPGDLAGKAMNIVFELAGQTFIALNGGPHYTFSPAISLFITCEDQAEVDRLWTAFAEGGKPNRCGWIDDRFGVTWQVIPRALPQLMTDPDPKKAAAVTAAMMGMGKIDVAALRRAHEAA